MSTCFILFFISFADELLVLLPTDQRAKILSTRQSLAPASFTSFRSLCIINPGRAAGLPRSLHLETSRGQKSFDISSETVFIFGLKFKGDSWALLKEVAGTRFQIFCELEAPIAVVNSGRGGKAFVGILRPSRSEAIVNL